MTERYSAVVQSWTSFETSGRASEATFSLHLTEEDRRRFVDQVTGIANVGPTQKRSTVTPEGNSLEVSVSTETYERLLENFPPDGSARGLWGAAVERSQDASMVYAELSLPLSTLDEVIVLQARDLAELDFAGVLRKAPKDYSGERKTFFSHLERVAVLLATSGFDRHVVAAGFLHDHIEDLGERWQKQNIGYYFGERVATLVDWVTEQDKTLSWEERKEGYHRRLQEAPAEAVAISCADKLSNLEDSIALMKLGYRPEQFLKSWFQDQYLRLTKALELYQATVPSILLDEFQARLEEYRALGN